MQSKEESNTFLKALLERSEELEKTLKELDDGNAWYKYCEFFGLEPTVSLRENINKILEEESN